MSGALLLVLPAFGKFKKYREIKKTSLTQSDNEERSTTNDKLSPIAVSFQMIQYF